MIALGWGLGFQLVGEWPPHTDRIRCQMPSCGRWTRRWVLQGLDVGVADPDATSRRICDPCALNHRFNLLPESRVEVEA